MRWIWFELGGACRRLGTDPARTALAVLTLALGIGTTTAIYSMVDALILNPAAFSGRPVVELLNPRFPDNPPRVFRVGDLSAIRERRDVFAAVAGYALRPATVAVPGGPTVDAPIVRVSPDLSSVLGVTAALGRLLGELDERQHARVVVLTHSFWQSRFGGDAAAIGRMLKIDDAAYEVVGVLPRGFSFPIQSAAGWTPLPPSPPARPLSVRAIALLNDGITTSQVQPRSGYPAIDFGDLRRDALGTRTFALLTGAVVLVFLIACVNVGIFWTARSVRRARDLAVLASLGASRSRLYAHCLAEPLLLACLAWLLGTTMAWGFVELGGRWLPRGLSGLSLRTPELDLTAIGIALLASAITVLLVGALPAMWLSRVKAQALLYSLGTHSAPRVFTRVSGGLVVTQFALALALLCGATSLVLTLRHVNQIPPGFDVERIATISVRLPNWKYAGRQAADLVFGQLASAAGAIPGVASVAVADSVPPLSSYQARTTIEIEGRGLVVEDAGLRLPEQYVGENYFETMGMRVVAGRGITSDDVAGAPLAVVINESFARTFWPEGQALGARILPNPKSPVFTVVGIVNDVYHVSPRRDTRFAVYCASAQREGDGLRQATLIARTDGRPAHQVLQALLQIPGRVDGDIATLQAQTASEGYREFFRQQEFSTAVLGLFAMAAVLIAAVGLFGTVAFTVTSRSGEIAIRAAVGATPANLMRLFARTALTLVTVGGALGVTLNLAMANSIAPLLVGVSATELIVVLGAIVPLAASALLAVWIPVRRAVAVSPAVTLSRS